MLRILQERRRFVVLQKLCRRIAILENGKLLACDTLPHLLKLLDPTIRLTLATTPAGFADRIAAIPGVKTVTGNAEGFKLVVDDVPSVLAKIATLCNEKNVVITAVSTREPSLEQQGSC